MLCGNILGHMDTLASLSSNHATFSPYLGCKEGLLVLCCVVFVLFLSYEFKAVWPFFCH